MAALLDHVDPDGLLEFSVVFTDRSLNHMSASFKQVMTDISDMLKQVYCADAIAIVPGGGTFGMEAVARQFGRDAKVMVVRNGWFSYRWSQIFEAGGFTSDTHVIKARQSDNGAQYQTASNNSELDAVIDSMISGAPLDRAQEQQAISAKWQLNQ